MATTHSTPEETTMSAPKRFVKACIQYDVSSMVVDQLEENMRTRSHEALHAYNVQTMRPGLLVHYLKVWSARVVKSRKARNIMAGRGRKQAISIVQ